jgi:hypothetical protein
MLVVPESEESLGMKLSRSSMTEDLSLNSVTGTFISGRGNLGFFDYGVNI